MTAFSSEATVLITKFQQITSVDLTDSSALGQATTDNVVGAFLAAGQGYTGLTVKANADAKGVTVGTAGSTRDILYNLGGGYPLRSPEVIDLTPQINALPDATQSMIVLIVASGQSSQAQETRTLEDASRQPTNPADLWPTVQQVLTTRVVRSCVPDIVPGVPAVVPQSPAYNPLLCLLATVTINKTGVVSVVQNTAAQITRLDQIAPLVAAQGVLLATLQAASTGLLSSVSALTLALSQLRRDTAAQISALQAALTALAAQQATAATPGSVVTITDTYTDTSGLTVTPGPNPGYAVGTGLTFPQSVTNPINFFPLAQYASNLKVLGGRYLTAPYTEVKDGGNAIDFRHNANGVYVYPAALGPLSVTPLQEGFAVQRTRYGATYAAQSAAALLSQGSPSQLFGSASYPIVYDPTWLAWTSFAPELSHVNGLWRDLSARGLWGPRAAGAAIGNLPAVSEVMQASTDDMLTEIIFYHAGAPTSMRFLLCEELNGAPDFNSVLVDVMGTPLTNGQAGMEFVMPCPVLRKGARRLHHVFVFTDPASSAFVTTPDADTQKLDPAMKTLLYRTSNGGWAQDPNNQHITCTYRRANFTQGTPIELNTVTMNGGIDNLDILTPAVVPQGCDVYYGAFSASGYTRFGAIDPANPASNVLAGRPSVLRLAVEIVPTGRTAPVIDMAPTAIGSTAAVPARRAGTLTAQSAVRAPVNAAGAAVAVTTITQTVTLQGYNPSGAPAHTFAVQLGTGAGYATPLNPTTTSGPTAQPDGTVQFTFTWKLGAGVTSFVTNYSGTTQDVTQVFTITKAITTAAP